MPENSPWFFLAICYVLIGLTQQPPQKPNLPNLLDTSRSILVSFKQQEDNQYGSGGADYICGFSGTVQDRGTMPGVFIPANEEIIGSIACYGNEIDDLIVNKKYQHKGYGKQLLLWGMQCIRKKNTEPIVLHVAEWNKNALLLYKKNGFEITNIEKIR